MEQPPILQLPEAIPIVRNVKPKNPFIRLRKEYNTDVNDPISLESVKINLTEMENAMNPLIERINKVLNHPKFQEFVKENITLPPMELDRKKLSEPSQISVQDHDKIIIFLKENPDLNISDAEFIKAMEAYKVELYKFQQQADFAIKRTSLNKQGYTKFFAEHILPKQAPTIDEQI